MDPQPLSLENLAGGAAIELWRVELSRVLANIEDVNTDAEAARKITLEVVFAPGEKRDAASVTLRVASKLAPINAARTTVYMGRRHGQRFAVESNPQQLLMGLEAPGDVVQMRTGEGDKA